MTKKVTVSASDFAKRIAELEGQLALIKSTLVVAPKAPKFTTATEAKNDYRAKHNITEETKAQAKALREANFVKDWAKWTASAAYAAVSGAARKEANRAKAKALYAAYDKKAGMVF
jgi:hypothetical protein